MIPNRMLSSEIRGNGLKGRVTACRKRLRISRVAQRARANNDAEELFAETTPTVSSFHDYTADYSVTASVVSTDYRSPFADAEPEESGTLWLAGEQEVGIP